MKSIIIYYSYSGNTRKVANTLKDYLEKRGEVEVIDLEALDESKNFFIQAKRAFFKKEADIKNVKLDLSEFSLICLGTPVWAFGPAPAMNAYLKKCQGLKGKNVVFFTTHGSGTGKDKCVKFMESQLKGQGPASFRNFSIQQRYVGDKEFIVHIAQCNLGMNKILLIGVIGGHKCDKKTESIAYDIGKGIAELGAILICGGLGGVMQAAAKGAQENGGLTVGILSTDDKRDANKYIDVPIATGLGYTRNTLVTTASDILIALKGKYGTLSEIGFALNAKKPVIGIDSWKIKGVKKVQNAQQAIGIIKKIIKNGIF